MELRLAELRYREVIDVANGTRLGYVSDVLTDTESGRIVALIVPGQPRYMGLFGREEDYVLPWGSIKCMGEDIILVEGARPGRHCRPERKPWS